MICFFNTWCIIFYKSTKIKIKENKDNVLPAADAAFVIKKIIGPGITLTKNDRKDIVKVITSLEKRGIILNRITEKTTTQERGLLGNFLLH